jgi:hypothetical protein
MSIKKQMEFYQALKSVDDYDGEDEFDPFDNI